MTERQKALIELAEQAPDTKIVATLIRVMLVSPSRSFAAFQSLMELWSRLRADQRAVLVMALDSSLSIEQIAQLAGVNRRTLYKSVMFQRAREFVISQRSGSACRGVVRDEDLDDCDDSEEHIDDFFE